MASPPPPPPPSKLPPPPPPPPKPTAHSLAREMPKLNKTVTNDRSGAILKIPGQSTGRNDGSLPTLDASGGLSSGLDESGGSLPVHDARSGGGVIFAEIQARLRNRSGVGSAPSSPSGQCRLPQNPPPLQMPTPSSPKPASGTTAPPPSPAQGSSPNSPMRFTVTMPQTSLPSPKSEDGLDKRFKFPSPSTLPPPNFGSRPSLLSPRALGTRPPRCM